MSEWCHNRLEITGKSVCSMSCCRDKQIDGTARHRHAVQQSIQLLFRRGGDTRRCGPRRIRPVRGWSVQAPGFPIAANQAFESCWRSC